MKYIFLILMFISSTSHAQTYIKGPALIEGVTSTATAAGTTTLTKDSQTNQILTGVTTQTVVLPNATTLPVGRSFYIANESTGLVTVNYNGGSLAKVIGANAAITIRLRNNGTAAGTWNIYDGSMPSTTFTLGSVIFAGTGGVFSQDNSNFFWDDTSNLLGLGVSVPVDKIHQDSGTGVASAHKFTAGTTTGQTSTDGFNVGITSTGAAELRQYENSALTLYTNNTERINIQNGGSVNVIPSMTVNAATGSTPAAALDIWNGAVGILIGADSSVSTRTNSTRKLGRMGQVHYTNSEEPLGVFFSDSSVSTSVIGFGGGSSNFNAATQIVYYTAANTTTTTGTRRLSIESNGSVVVGSGAGALATSATDGFLYISTSAGPPTGVPATQTGSLPIHIDSTNGSLMYYLGGWKNSNQSFWYVDATMEGGNFDLGVTAFTSYTEISNASMTLTPRTGSSAVGVMCSSTNAATAPSTSPTTCAAGSESAGINFTLPTAVGGSGAYQVCVEFTHAMTVDSAEAIDTAFQLIETPTNATTLTQEGGSRVQSGILGMTIATGVDQAVKHAMNTCAIFDWSSKGNGATVGVRLMYEQAIVGAPDSSLILADANASNGQRNMRWTVRKW